MINYTFGGYEDFKEIFELREHGNGVKSRRNGILLAYYKNPRLIKWAREHNDTALMSIKTMASLKTYCIERICREFYKFHGILNLKNFTWGSDFYRTDHMRGKTEDGDARSIRYVRLDNEKVYKMKAGKLYRHLILETDFGKMLAPQVVTWLCEELVFDWCGYNTKSEYELHVDDHFDRIYDSDYCKGDFGSCMQDNGQHVFYEKSVKAKAAYLTDRDGKIVARAILFTEVYDQDTGEKFRLLERQYSSGHDDSLKQILVNKLIEGGYIDGYKRVGADCHSPKAFVDIHGNDLSTRYFYIDCQLDYGDTLSYQDTFKWYSMDENIAYNWDCHKSEHDLATTSRRLQDDRNYDEYHDRYTENDLVTVYVDGREMDCDEEELDDFTRVNGRYYHYDNVSVCDCCDEYYVEADGAPYYSDITEGYYCCEDCRENAEYEYCRSHPDKYVEINGEFFPIDEVVYCDHCGEACHPDTDLEHSELTDGDYCCEECKYNDEREYIEDNPDCGYGICSECDDIMPIDELTQNDDGTYICNDCLKAVNTYSFNQIFITNPNNTTTQYETV